MFNIFKTINMDDASTCSRTDLYICSSIICIYKTTVIVIAYFSKIIRYGIFIITTVHKISRKAKNNGVVSVSCYDILTEGPG